MLLDPRLKLMLERIAAAKGIPYQTLIQIWLRERSTRSTATGIEAGILAAATSLVNTAFVGGAWETGVAMGSAIGAGIDKLADDCNCD